MVTKTHTENLTNCFSLNFKLKKEKKRNDQSKLLNMFLAKALPLGLPEMYRQLKALCHVDIEHYFQYFPAMESIKNADSLKNISSFPQVEDLVDGLIFGLVLCLLRVVLDYLVFRPLGTWCMKHSGKEKFEHFRNVSKMRERMVVELDDVPIESSQQVKDLANKYEASNKEMKEYIELRNQKRTEEKQLHKFSEVSFKVICHILLTFYGIYHIVLGTDWLIDPKNNMWKQFPMMTLNTAQFWYVMAEFGYYIHEFTFFWFESKRSDDAMMLTHHISTLILIGCSYIFNLNCIGMCVMVIHDVADAFLEFAKLFNYMKDARPWAEGVSDGLFICFAISFIVTRCGVFPYKVLYQGVFLSRNVTITPSVVFDALCGFLFVLQILHIIWSSMILKMALTFLKGDKIDDNRSMVEGLQKSFSTLTSEEQEEEVERKRQAIKKLDKLAHDGCQMNKKNI